MRRVLFICTGNYYRSRFAEAVFNHYATAHKVPAKAFSRGLATWLIGESDGTISRNTVAELKRLDINLTHTGEKPVQLSEADLIGSDVIIALKETEHRPMMIKQFPAWSDKIVYWEVHDIDFASPTQALPQIEKKVRQLIDTLSLTKPKKKKRKS